MMAGYICVMSNRTTPGLYKICSASQDFIERLSRLDSSDAYVGFDIEYYLYVDFYPDVEHRVHCNLDKYKVDREFFKCNLMTCILELKRIAKNKGYHEEKYRSELLKSQVEACEDIYLAKIEAEGKLLSAEGTAREIAAQKGEDEKKIQSLQLQRLIGCIVISIVIGMLFTVRADEVWPLGLCFGLGVIVAFILFYSDIHNSS